MSIQPKPVAAKPTIFPWDTVIRVIGIAVLPALGWMANTVIDHGQVLAAITSNRFTAGDGAAVWREIAGIREHMAQLPPPELLQRLAVVEANQATLVSNQAKILDELAVIRNK